MGDGRMTEMAEELDAHMRNERRRRGLQPNEIDILSYRRGDSSRERLHQRIERVLLGRYGDAGRRAIETNAEANAIHNCAVELLTDIFTGGRS